MHISPSYFPFHISSLLNRKHFLHGFSAELNLKTLSFWLEAAQNHNGIDQKWGKSSKNLAVIKAASSFLVQIPQPKATFDMS